MAEEEEGEGKRGADDEDRDGGDGKTNASSIFSSSTNMSMRFNSL